jgi:hypothetical protein
MVFFSFGSRGGIMKHVPHQGLVGDREEKWKIGVIVVSA